MQFQNPVVLITGAAKRIGACIARTLHFANYNVVIHYHHSQTEATALAKELNQLRPDSAITLRADLLNTAQLPDLIASAAQAWQRLDVLVNNASTFYPTPLGFVTEVEWGDLLGSNVKAPFFLAQAAIPFLQQQKGNIINIVDIHVHRPLREHSVYCIAKAGLEMLTRSLAKELAPGIRVNGISPGAIIWPEGQNEVDPATQAKIIANIPLHRIGDPQDIADAAKFLLAHQYVTGQVIAIDGGKSIG